MLSDSRSGMCSCVGYGFLAFSPGRSDDDVRQSFFSMMAWHGRSFEEKDVSASARWRRMKQDVSKRVRVKRMREERERHSGTHYYSGFGNGGAENRFRAWEIRRN